MFRLSRNTSRGVLIKDYDEFLMSIFKLFESLEVLFPSRQICGQVVNILDTKLLLHILLMTIGYFKIFFSVLSN